MIQTRTAAGADKTSLVRDHILGRLERGELAAGDRLPGARDLALELGISFLKVQQALETLTQDGVLGVKPRVGTFVQSAWRDRVLRDNLSIFNTRERLPWIDGLSELIADDLPGLRFTHVFRQGVLELKTTQHLQRHHDRYLDLGPAFAAAYGDGGDFFAQPFAPFRVGSKLIGVPFIFSPRVLFYRPSMLEAAGCDIPQAGWSWTDFIELVRRLVADRPGTTVCNWTHMTYFWLNLVRRAGGGLIDPEGDDPVTLDHERTRVGLRCAAELRDLLTANGSLAGSGDAFINGEGALQISDRENIPRLRAAGIGDWATAPLPQIPGGADVTSQATDLLCVRADCRDPGLAERYVRVMLSERVQHYIADQRYGIPIRRSSAFRSLDPSDPTDALFAAEIPKLRSEPTCAQPELYRFLSRGCERILAMKLDIDTATAELAAAARTMHAVTTFRPGDPA